MCQSLKGKTVTISAFVDSNYAGNVVIIIYHTGVRVHTFFGTQRNITWRKRKCLPVSLCHYIFLRRLYRLYVIS